MLVVFIHCLVPLFRGGVLNAIIAMFIGLGRESIHLLHGSTGRAEFL